jgi:tetratricopeptide (TPR) repeat protein
MYRNYKMKYLWPVFVLCLIIGRTEAQTGKKVLVVALIDSDILATGDSLIDIGKYKEAIEAYTTVIELSPKKPEAYTRRGVAYLQMDDYKHALPDLNTAITLDSTDSKTYSNRGLVKFYLKDYQGAISDCEKALKINPDYAYADFHLGLAYYYSGNTPKALACLDKAIELNPEFAIAFFNRGSINLSEGKKDAACKDWIRAKSLGYPKADKLIETNCGLSAAGSDSTKEQKPKIGQNIISAFLNKCLTEDKMDSSLNDKFQSNANFNFENCFRKIDKDSFFVVEGYRYRLKEMPVEENADSIAISLGHVDHYRQKATILRPIIFYYFKNGRKEDAMKKFNDLDKKIASLASKRSSEKPRRKNNVIKIVYTRLQKATNSDIISLDLDHSDGAEWVVSVSF